MIVRDVLGRDWFHRMWTIQEFALSRVARFQYGNSGILWETLLLGIQTLTAGLRRPGGYTVVEKDFEGVLDLYHRIRSAVEAKRGSQPTTTKLPFADLLLTTGREASEPRDKAYSLYGLFNLFGMAVPEADYSKSLELIYRELTQAAILHDKAPMVLDFICIRERDERLPPWVPNWNGDMTGWAMAPRKFDATKSSTPSCSFSQSGCRLTISGILVDKIDERAELVFETKSGKWTGGTVAPAFETIRVIQQWQDFAVRRFPEPYKTGQTVQDAFFRSLIEHGAAAKERNIENYRKSFKQWHEAVMSADLGEVLAKYHGKEESEIFPALGLEGAGTYFHVQMSFHTRRKAFCSTATGFMAMVPEAARAGDLVILLAGLSLPFVVRRDQDCDTYRLIGPAYVHGMMDGELWPGNPGSLSKFTFD